MTIEYFLLKNLGYDGILCLRKGTYEEAETKYKELLKEDKSFNERFPGVDKDKGTVVIMGEVVIADHPEELFD